MPEMKEYPPGTPSWVDLGSPDAPASAAFYDALFGWSTQAAGDPEQTGGYMMAMFKGFPVAGIGPLMNQGQPPSWTTYVSVANADDTTGKARDAGGAVFVEPMDVMTVGRMAVLADPQGAVISLWQPRDHIGAGLVNEPGTLCWNELATSDVGGAKAFYTKVFGWEGSDVEGGPIPYTEWKLDGRTIAGMMPMSAGSFPPGVPPHWLSYFAVEDCDASAKKAEELGGKVMVPPTDIPPGRFAVASDPHGAVFGIMRLAS
jgi:predicted enzyme related to lactoylglutathione lyase